jgi:hypothetical protein
MGRTSALQRGELLYRLAEAIEQGVRVNVDAQLPPFCKR